MFKFHFCFRKKWLLIQLIFILGRSALRPHLMTTWIIIFIRQLSMRLSAVVMWSLAQCGLQLEMEWSAPSQRRQACDSTKTLGILLKVIHTELWRQNRNLGLGTPSSGQPQLRKPSLIKQQRLCTRGSGTTQANQHGYLVTPLIKGQQERTNCGLKLNHWLELLISLYFSLPWENTSWHLFFMAFQIWPRSSYQSFWKWLF